MRFQNRYKNYDQSIQIFEKFPLRILKFKNTKWERLQKKLLSKIRKKKLKDSKYKKFKNNLLIKIEFKIWEKVKDFYRNGRKATNFISNTFDNTFTNSQLKVRLLASKVSDETLNIYRQTLLKPEFKLNILLWRLDFFCSSFQASQAIHDKKILVNGKFVEGSFSLLKGDVIYIATEAYNKNFRKSKIKFSPSDGILSFIEVDYYTSLVVIIKDLENLSNQDLYFIRPEFDNLKSIKDYI
jgi:ribosomal protein S4